MNRGTLFVLSAPSGTGKTTLIRSMMEGGLSSFGGLVFSVSHTTRKARVGEVDGRDYHFVDHPTFERMIEENKFLEWAEVHNQYKGTSYEEVLPRLEKGIDVLVDIDVQGGEQVLRRYPDSVSIFIMPPSYRDLESRLIQRGLDDPDEIRRRLDVSHSEIERYRLYQYVIVNDDLERASHVLAAIILERRHRLDRMDETVSRVLGAFPGKGRKREDSGPVSPTDAPAMASGLGTKAGAGENGYGKE
ncbi:MAG: guanylate kinase [Acidobacteriota bacterium]|nr:guanylate kinase [Acidobacteriota bacterium]